MINELKRKLRCFRKNKTLQAIVITGMDTLKKCPMVCVQGKDSFY